MTGIRSTGADYGRHDRRMAGVLADPDLDPLLLRWLAVTARAVDRLDRWPQEHTGRTFADRAGIAWDGYSLRSSITRDVRRYDPYAAGYRYQQPCDAPMIRRTGSCGQRSSTSTLLTNLDTGEQVPLAACGRHYDWYRRTTHEHARAAAGRIVPRPYANTGGRLAAHVPEVDWTSVYRWAARDPEWTWPPERLAPATRPTLELLIGEKRPPAPPRAVPTPTREQLRERVTGQRRHLEPVPAGHTDGGTVTDSND